MNLQYPHALEFTSFLPSFLPSTLSGFRRSLNESGIQIVILIFIIRLLNPSKARPPPVGSTIHLRP